MALLDMLTSGASAAAALLGGGQCGLPPSPAIIDVRPLEMPMQRDFTKTGPELGAIGGDVHAPIPQTQNALGGMMRTELVAETHVTFDGTGAEEAACIWVKTVTVDVVLSPTLYVNAAYPPGTCMHNAIAEHELTHYAIDQQIVLDFLPYVQAAADNAVRQIGVIGPMPASLTRQQGGPVGEQITAEVRTVIEAINERRRQAHQSFDNPLENMAVMQACGPGGSVPAINNFNAQHGAR